ncbi:MAG: NUDIX hydrolase, partial [Chloroflexota bacterium]
FRMVEELLSSRRVFHGRLVSVRQDEVRLPEGRESMREVVEHPGAVGILPVDRAGNLILVRQYRYAVERELLEIPAGTREPGEPPRDCAIRELKEETGLSAGRIEWMTSFYVSPGWCTEELIIYRATDLTQGDTELEVDEQLEPVVIRPADVPGLMRDGVIGDAKTVTAILVHLQSVG